MSKKNNYNKKNNSRVLPLNGAVYSVAFKFYDEQLKFGWGYTCQCIRSVSLSDYQIIGIRHYKDTYAEEGTFWKPAAEKPHYHVILRCADRKARVRINKVLDMLGIEYRRGYDDELWRNRGVETVDTFPGYTAYLTHETEDAIADGKELYDRSELVSNLTPDEIDEVRQGYLRVSEGARKVTTKNLVDLDYQADNLGYALGDFNSWYNSLPFVVRSHAKMKTIRESYTRGVDTKIAEHNEVLRLCVFIKGLPNTGKTYGSKKALSGKKIHTVEGGGTGKFDDLRPDHDAIIISDDVCPNLINMSDNYICKAYKRGSNNPAWAGNYFIVTSNLTFSEWLESCKINVYKDKDETQFSDHYKALKSRFFVCEIKEGRDGKNYLAVESVCERGTAEEQTQRINMFKDFKEKFDRVISAYVPADTTNHDYLIDPEFLPPDRLVQSHPTYAFNVLGRFTEWFWNGQSDYSPWTKANKRGAKTDDKIAFVRGLPCADIERAAQGYKDYAILEHFSVDLIRGALEEVLRDYNIDDFNCNAGELP